jgi:uncharacterized protein (UPF0333 family)
MRKSSFFIGLLLIIAIAAAAYFIMQTVRESTASTLAPLQQANNALQTQVSDLLHPTPTIIPDPVTIIHDVRALARLETIQYTVEKVITAETGQGSLSFLLGDRLLFVAHGIVIAGIDMEKINPEDMQLSGELLNVRLPAAEVFVATLDNGKSYVYDRETGLLRTPDQNLETLARQTGEDEIRKAAIEDGILAIAQQNAETFLQKFFNALGYKNVSFVK